ncbi:hypothetical protein ACYX34_15825 [Nitrospira sp. CMX1]
MPIRSTVMFAADMVMDHPELVDLRGHQHGTEAKVSASDSGGMVLLTLTGNRSYDAISWIFLTGQINSRFLRPDPTIGQIGFQETDIVAMAAPVTKYAKTIVRPEDVRYLSREEFRSNMLIEPAEGWMSPEYPDVVKPRDTSRKEAA